MKSLFFIFGLLFGCQPSELETTWTSSDDTNIIIEILEPIGVLPAADCQHIGPGNKACNFRLTDQDGDTWDLYSHTGDVIVLDFSTVWCYPCQLAGHHAQPLQDEYSNDNVKFVTVLLDGATSGVEPSEEEINDWVVSHNITTAPVLQGSREKMLATDPDAYDGYLLSGFPTYVYIGRDMKFYSAHVGFSESHVRQTIEEGL
tara:strand:+ start:7217 stop:7822 length:606 start_codon:yes stop_codon:yes gene_type:complete